MRRAIVAAAALATFCAPVSAFAATIIANTTQSGVSLAFGASPPLTEKVKENSAGTGTDLVLRAEPSNNLVDFTSPDQITTGDNGDGFAFVSGIKTSPPKPKDLGFSSLTIDPRAPATGFTAINFNIDPLGSGSADLYGDIILSLFGGGIVTFENVLFKESGANKFLISGDPGLIFNSIQFANLASGETNTTTNAVNFDSIRQVSLNLTSAVPEPATWAMMIGGFGFVGGAMRLARKRQALGYAVA